MKAECCKDLQPELAPALIELGTETTRAIASIIFDGAASRYPDIRFIFSHGGGTMPYLMTRFAALAARPDIAQRLPNGLLYEVQKLYYDTASLYGPYPWPTLLKLVPVSHILFGTDFPFMQRGGGCQRIERSGIESERPSRHRTGKSPAIVSAVQERLSAINNHCVLSLSNIAVRVYISRYEIKIGYLELRILAQAGVLP